MKHFEATMRNILKLTLGLASAIVLLPAITATADTTLFNSKGDAVAYIDDDDLTIYLWSGKSVAYLETGSVWAFNGDHLGWYAHGIIRDHDGDIVGCVKDAVIMTYNFEPFKGFKQFVPFKEFKKHAPDKPDDKNEWSATTLALFLQDNP
jgi:hypothetical protein